MLFLHLVSVVFGFAIPRSLCMFGKCYIFLQFRIDRQGVIKVADFGLTEDMYDANYYRQEKGTEGKVPIRWMAPESIEDNIYNEKTDVVRTKHRVTVSVWYCISFQ